MERYVVIDLETTGNNPTADDKIIDVGIVVIENQQIIDEFATLLNPNQPIPPFIANLTGISDDDVKDAPTFEDIADEIIERFQDGYLVAHNVPFDLGFLNAELKKAGKEPLKNPIMDTVELARILFPQAPGYQLGQLAEHFQLTHDQPHRALSDAQVTAKLLLILIKKINTLPYETVTQLLTLEKHLHSDLYELLLARQKAAQFETQEAYLTYKGIAYLNPDEKQNAQVELSLSYGHFLDDIYEQAGTMEKHIPNYERREGQRDISEFIYDAFHLKKHALIEAGTGIGKTIAYLLPAVYEAITSNKRVVIATHTTQLQSQMLEEDIPLVKKLVNIPFRVAVLKGRQHYISLNRFEQSLHQQQENYDVILTKAKILIWLTETKTGDIEEIRLPASGYHYFKTISAQAETYQWDPHSYYYRARTRAEQADLVITNHALLCADMTNQSQLIPAYNKVIIDEAHHFEKVASQHFGLTLSYTQVQHALSEISTLLIDQSNQGVSTEDRYDLLTQTQQETDELFRALFQFVIKQKQQPAYSDVGRIQLHLDQPISLTQDPLFNDRLQRVLHLYRKLVQHLTTLTPSQAVHHPEIFQDDVDRHIQTLEKLRETLNTYFLSEDPTLVKWLEIEQNGALNAVYLYSEPVDIANRLADDFFKQKDSVILTSATLTVRQSFKNIQERLGILSDDVMTMAIKSPFNYKEQVQLLIPNDFPKVNDTSSDDFIYSTCEAIISLAEVTKGRMLVLFTSYDMLKKSYYLLKETLDLDRYALIAQGISSGSRSRLKKNFQTFNQAILLGTSSFWEGVDIPGDDLSCVMIVKLPFDPPGHPMYEARAKSLKDEGKNAFMTLSLPNAVTRFKQGFGRLIRTSQDRGIVFVCDARIKTARYGKFFTESIPQVPISYDSTYNLIQKAKEWF